MMRWFMPILLALLVLGGLVMPDVGFAQDALPGAGLADPVGDAAVELADELRDMPVASSVRIIVLLTALSLLPAMLIVMTPFTRFVVVFSMLRQALGLQQAPPNQVLVGLALFMSLLVMRPTVDAVVEEAIDPYIAGEIETGEAVTNALAPMRIFMLRNTRRTDLATIMEIGRLEAPETVQDVPTVAVASAFVLSELKTSFVIGVKVFLPFLVIDIIVANILLGMGMMVLPPVIISLPFKILLFVLMDGWNLLIRSMSAGF
ncbi:MAG: flagellar biosynthetic protein FliP [Deltaproteobacteria bacterium]|nr:flagellar biosynthetic protein FliP [Deltaproteobacteria bacterium]HCH62973.1 flagellar biosynthetic protein FliP [Deltaproteobacteria bacterium]